MKPLIFIVLFYFVSYHSFCIKQLEKKHLTSRRMAANTILPKDSENNHFFSKKSLKDIGISDKLISISRSIGIEYPSKIQALSFKPIQEQNNCILADQTGSGKTLAFLLPIMQCFIEKRTESSPFCIILTPTSELAMQISSAVKKLSNALKFRTVEFTEHCNFDKQFKNLRLGCDFLISTPNRLSYLIKTNKISLSTTKFFVLDEADIIFMDESFKLNEIGSASSKNATFIFSTATLPKLALDKIKSEFPNLLTLFGPGLHKISPKIKLDIIDCSIKKGFKKDFEMMFANKKNHLIHILSGTNDIRTLRTLIFCNTIDQCRRVENLLNRNSSITMNYKIYSFHSAIEPNKRESNLKSFSNPSLKFSKILICTDKASRGFDFSGSKIDHVILFDFPKEESELIRRIGRTGRAGKLGKASLFVYGKQVAAADSLVQSIQESKRNLL